VDQDRTMHVTVKLFGTLRRFSPKDTPGVWSGEILPGSTLLQLVACLGAPQDEVAAAAINGETVPLETVIPENATVMLVTHVNGG
jgi:sulfur carrier protein ThiS